MDFGEILMIFRRRQERQWIVKVMKKRKQEKQTRAEMGGI